MESGQKLQIVLGSAMLASVLGFMTQFLLLSLYHNPNRSLLGFSGLESISTVVSFFIWGAILSFILIHINSLKLSLVLTSIVIFLSVSGNIRRAFDLYLLDDSHPVFVEWELLEIVSGFIIFTLIGFLIRFIKSDSDNSLHI